MMMRKQVIRLTVGREGERGEVEHDKIISIYIYSARLHNYYLEKLDKFQLDIFILSGSK